MPHLLRVLLPPRHVLGVRDVPEVVHGLTADLLVVDGGVERVLVRHDWVDRLRVRHRGRAAQVVGVRVPPQGPLPTAVAGAADGVG